MDMYQEYSKQVQLDLLHEGQEVCFSKSIEFEYCECGKRVTECKDAYEHMSRGY